MQGEASVFHIVTSLDFGGVESQMEILADAANTSSWAHRILAIGQGGAVERAMVKNGHKVRCLNFATSIPNWAAVGSLRGLFRKTQPTVVHTHGAEANFHGLIAAKLAGVPVRIGEEIGIPKHSAHARFIFSQVYRAAHRVVGISDAVRHWLVESGEVPERKAVRVYNPVRLPGESLKGSGGAGLLRIGFVGRLEPVKNPFSLLQAIQKLVERGVATELWIVGEGSERDKLDEYVRAHGLGERVRLLGFQPDPAEAMRQCDIYVQPSISEGFGLALVEAMGMGLPVIATAVGGAPEIIEHGRTGWLLAEATPTAVAAAIEQVGCMDVSERLAVGCAAAAAVRGRFEPASYLQEIESLYRDALGDMR